MYKSKSGKRMKRPSTHKGKSKELGVGERCRKATPNMQTCHRLRYAGDTCEHVGYDGNIHPRNTPYGKPKQTGRSDYCIDDEKLSLCIGISQKHEERKANYPAFKNITEIKSILTPKDKFPLDSIDKNETKAEIVKVD